MRSRVRRKRCERDAQTNNAKCEKQPKRQGSHTYEMTTMCEKGDKEKGAVDRGWQETQNVEDPEAVLALKNRKPVLGEHRPRNGHQRDRGRDAKLVGLSLR